jgi:hypothetical protein
MDARFRIGGPSPQAREELTGLFGRFPLFAFWGLVNDGRITRRRRFARLVLLVPPASWDLCAWLMG